MPNRERSGHGFINELKRLKEVIEKWNKEVFSCIFTQKKKKKKKKKKDNTLHKLLDLIKWRKPALSY